MLKLSDFKLFNFFISSTVVLYFLAIDQSLRHIEDFLRSGAHKKFSLNYVKARWKLRKLRKCMSQLSSTTSHT